MNRAIAVAWVALVLGLGAGCKNDEDPPNGTGSGGSGGASSGSGGTTGSSGSTAGQAGKGGNAGGTSTMGGGSGSSGSGSAGSANAGSGNAGDSAGGRGGGGDPGDDAGAPGASCELLDCADGQHCELVQVTCVRAPCNPVPECVPNGGSAGSGGSGSGKTCGTRGTGSCVDGEFCKFPPGANCGRADAGGKCATQPMICTREFNPVCGCDGMTYSNACTAESAGVSVETEGECQTSSADPVDCDPRKVACDALPGACPDGEVRALLDGCYGDCVGIERCACSGPDACPEHDTYTCHMSAGHCGPYV